MRKYFEGIKRRVAAVVCASLILGMCPSTVIEGAVSRKFRTATSNDAWKDSTQSTPEEESGPPATSTNPADKYTGPGVSSTSTPSFYEIATVAMATRSTSEYDQFIVPSLSPQNVTVNLFDYWLTERKSSDIGAAHWEAERFFQSHSINMRKDGIPHALVFAGIERNQKQAFGDKKRDTNGGGPYAYSYNTYNRNNITADNKQFTSNPTQGIVNKKLGSDGYPELALNPQDAPDNTLDVASSFKYVKENNIIECDYDEIDPKESLAYLFNPDLDNDQDGKKSFENVKGLFLLDNDGNYYYRSKKNAAVFDENNNNITLYNKPAVGSGGYLGQFFPFNTAKDMFNIATDSDGKRILVSKIPQGRNTPLSHYFGLTMEVKFQQPLGGNISSSTEDKHMVFTYSGDDDIWIYIDDVLVADMGGIHDAVGVSIDFSDGVIEYNGEESKAYIPLDTLSSDFTKTSTLRKQFEAVYGENSNECKSMFDEGSNTFKDWSTHTLKVFYLERGNEDSNLSLSFNLMSPQAGEIHKVDQNGKPLGNVGFELYEATNKGTADDPRYETTGAAIAEFETEDNGLATLTTSSTEDGNLIFKDKQHYILREVKTPEGYITNGDIWLTYDKATGLFSVDNIWSTGATAGFRAEVYQGGTTLKYADGETVAASDREKGLVLAVPLYNEERNGANTDQTKWHPMYGSILEGYSIVQKEREYTTNTNARIRADILEAALRQAAESSSDNWYLEYDANNGRYEGSLDNLPGLASSYVRNKDQKDGYLAVSYYLIKPADGLFDGLTTADEKYKKLINTIRPNDKDTVSEAKIEEFVKANYDNIKQLDVENFNRHYFVRLYIPNQARTLQVYKEDENQKPLQGAEFTLYKLEDDADPNSKRIPVAKGVTDEKGLLDFSVENPAANGNGIGTGAKLTSHVNFALSAIRENDMIETEAKSYWLRETKAPEGYKLNDSEIEVLVTLDSMYVNAGDANNGVSVAKGVGYLVKTVARYAASEKIDVTLRDVLARKYVLSADQRPEKYSFGQEPWVIVDHDNPLKLHYHLKSTTGQGNMGYDYGVHDVDEEPYFVSVTGWLGYDVVQNLDAHKDPGDEYYVGYHEIRDLGTQDLSHLLSGSITVMVKDEKNGSGTLTITKVDEDTPTNKLVGAKFELAYISKEDYVKANEGNSIRVEWSDLATSSDAIKKQLENLGQLIFSNPRELTTLADGIATASDLPEGLYRLVEVQPPDGYQLDGTPIYFKICDGQAVNIELTVSNKKLILPSTGGPGTRSIYMMGVAMIGGAVLMGFRKKRRLSRIPKRSRI